MSFSVLALLAAATTVGGLGAVVVGACTIRRAWSAHALFVAGACILAYGALLVFRPPQWLMIDLGVLAGAMGGVLLVEGGLGRPAAVMIFLAVAAAVDAWSMFWGPSQLIVTRYRTGVSNLLPYLTLVAPVRGRSVPIVGIGDLFVGGAAATALLRLGCPPATVAMTFASGLLGALAYGLWRGGTPALPFLAVAVGILMWTCAGRERPSPGPGASANMPTTRDPRRPLQIAAFAAIGILVLGFVFSPVGAWTGPVLGAWLVGTQPAWRGYLLLSVINLVMTVASTWHGAPLAALVQAGWTALAVVVGLLPFLLYRLTTQRRQGLLAALSLPLWGAAFTVLAPRVLPSAMVHSGLLASAAAAGPLPPRVVEILGTGTVSFLIYWFAAVTNWFWSQEGQGRRMVRGGCVFTAVSVTVLGYGVLQSYPAAPTLPTTPGLGWICLAGGLVVSAWSLFRRGLQGGGWGQKSAAVALLRSPRTGASLSVVGERGHEALVSPSGERFPVRSGIPAFVDADQLTGPNRKYNRLYETIGGFYDDIQRVGCALRGVSLGQYLSDYLRFLEIKAGDTVLETSVGTGLNYRYLPRGLTLFGLDLSAEMLANCQANLRRWAIDADLVLGNAEELPFADDSFDVVFHVGGINFFNDRARAIREMIRVAKPGTLILIADETEEHVKRIYERLPVTSGYFRHRETAVAAPIDLVPPEMQQIHVEILRRGRFYALTFRKPVSATPSLGGPAEPTQTS
jgi:ubiquinone/menaquinone biosynthesis C-methylase UbiE